MHGFVRDANGLGVNGMIVKSWNDSGNEYRAVTKYKSDVDKNGYWDRAIGPGPRAGRWYVVLLDGEGRQSSDIATVVFTAGCEPGRGNVQDAEVLLSQNGELRSFELLWWGP
jgi:hypothetical protein